MNAGLLCDLYNVCNAIRLTDCRGKIIIIIIIIIILILVFILILIQVIIILILKAISNAILLNNPLQRPDLQLVSALLSSLMGALL